MQANGNLVLTVQNGNQKQLGKDHDILLVEVAKIVYHLLDEALLELLVSHNQAPHDLEQEVKVLGREILDFVVGHDGVVDGQ